MGMIPGMSKLTKDPTLTIPFTKVEATFFYDARRKKESELLNMNRKKKNCIV